MLQFSEMKSSAHKNEIMGTLRRVVKSMPAYKELAYILKPQGLKVHAVHFPPIKDVESRKEWNRQYESCRSAIAGHLKRPLTRRALQRAMERAEQAAKVSYRKAWEGAEQKGKRQEQGSAPWLSCLFPQL